ncbi:hypothetical protein A0J48_021120 [Sphaerospermopsis aphanizomenoides BCCUSP55]|uniref:hypothetical protein n=1 Tax=Sphaerospermopsis aphanizomenoides TaxID=459663 RepID=UPI001F30C5FD|nr:hypothetical protein [Sphaerospermopsis aphanizomenoides]MBK1989998.1 hypothetical protein [Sphaerospermopsis aphanizomenoides BCCUSP55]
MKKFTKLGKKLFVLKSWQSFALCLATSFVAILLFSFQFQSKMLASSPYDNVINVKSDIKVAQSTEPIPVTFDSSSCARAFVAALEEYIGIEQADAVWESNGQLYTYSYEGQAKSNNKSLPNNEPLVNQKVFPSSNFLAGRGHNVREIVSRVLRGVANDGAKVLRMNVRGEYHNNGGLCAFSYPCDPSKHYCTY